MEKITIEVEGMACGMCEAHVCEAIRNAYPVKRVRASRRRHEVEVCTAEAIDLEALRGVIEGLGYLVQGIKSEPYVKRGWFRRG